jgi:hypothetical protein
MPKPRANALIVRLGAREGGQISDLAVGGQDEPAYVVTVRVSRGKRPIYVVATSPDPVLWKFTGSVSRVQSLVVSTRSDIAGTVSPHVAESGIPRKRFHRVPYECFGDFAENNMGKYFAASGLAGKVKQHLGRRTFKYFAEYRVQGITIPSMVPFAVRTSRPANLRFRKGSRALSEWSDFIGHFPGGVAQSDRRKVVSVGRLRRFETYPYGAGLAQLLASGAIEKASPRGYDGFRILKPMRFPPALHGGYSEQFELPTGVPMPLGDPGHSQVWGKDNVCLLGCH